MNIEMNKAALSVSRFVVVQSLDLLAIGHEPSP